MKDRMESLLWSFIYAFQGIWYCIRNERNFRIHLVAAAYTLILARLLSLSMFHVLPLLLVIAAVIATEMINTAIESIVDIISPERRPLAKVAKDVAAGAVLILALTSLIIGFTLFWMPTRLWAVLGWILDSWQRTAAAAVLLAISLLFIFYPSKKAGQKNKNNNKKAYK